MHRPRRPGWRSDLRWNGPEFLTWLEDGRVPNRVFELLANDLESYILFGLQDARAAQTFMEAIPDVVARCDEDIYNDPLRAEAFAFMHLLERYRRMWRVLAELTRTAHLPLARHGIRALDVGTGPAPVLFAINDFYCALLQFAGARQIGRLRTPPPQLRSVEGSSEMQWFVHRFCEWARRTAGPFAAEWSDFAEFDPTTRRSAELAARVSRIMQEDDTSEAYARSWVDMNEGYRQGAYTYRMCVFSNFLTTRGMIDHYQARLDAAFHAVAPGGVVLIIGGASRAYADIYSEVHARAAEAGLRLLDLPARFDPPVPDPYGATINRVYASVWQRLVDLGAVDTDLDRSLRALFDPAVPYTTTSFELSAFRRDGRDG